MWHQGKRRDAFKKSLTVLLFTSEKDEERGGRERDAILVLILLWGEEAGYSDCCHHLNHAFNLPHCSCL